MHFSWGLIKYLSIYLSCCCGNRCRLEAPGFSGLLFGSNFMQRQLQACASLMMGHWRRAGRRLGQVPSTGRRTELQKKTQGWRRGGFGLREPKPSRCQMKRNPNKGAKCLSS